MNVEIIVVQQNDHHKGILTPLKWTGTVTQKTWKGFTVLSKERKRTKKKERFLYNEYYGKCPNMIVVKRRVVIRVTV